MTNCDSIFTAVNHDVSTVGKEDLWHCRFGHLGAENFSEIFHEIKIYCKQNWKIFFFNF